MTNSTLPDPGAERSLELLAPAPVGGKRRPVKVVEHPAFRPYRRRVALDLPFTMLRIPVVALQGTAKAAGRRTISSSFMPEAH